MAFNGHDISRLKPFETAAAEERNETVAEKADNHRADGDGASVECHCAVAQAEIGLQERDDVALDADKVGEIPEQKIRIPGYRVAAQGAVRRGDVPAPRSGTRCRRYNRQEMVTLL